ncbi:unnamed protein product, partial [Amoebophrya sp. A25]|eukprot:GSA25T00012245001.1
MRLSGHEIAFVLGKGGSTKAKIASAAGCSIDIDSERGVAEVFSNTSFFNVKKGLKYVRLCKLSRNINVRLRLPDDDDGDLTVMRVPSDCAGFVTGREGAFLRACEEQYGTFMFFCDLPDLDRGAAAANNSPSPMDDGVDYLAVFGDEMGRKGASLKIMGAVETKLPGYYLDDIDSNYISDEAGFDTETRQLSNDEMSFAMGREGLTRRKIARASNGGVLEFVGLVAFLCGKMPVRRRLRDYLEMLLKQRAYGHIHVPDKMERDDCTVLKIPSTYMGLVRG